MPTYEYACPTCGIVEVFQSIKEDALKKCPKCKKQKVTRMVSSGVGVIFKGSGFWETDYNKKKEPAATPAADAAPAPAKPPVPESKTKPKMKPVDSTPSAPPAAPTGKA